MKKAKIKKVNTTSKKPVINENKNIITKKKAGKKATKKVTKKSSNRLSEKKPISKKTSVKKYVKEAVALKDPKGGSF